MHHALKPLPLAAALACLANAAWAQAAADTDHPRLPGVSVKASSADASAEGLSPAYPGGQVARGGRAGILGTRDNQGTPFSITSYTNELIQDRHARSVGDVLQNDPTVRVARGFGNFQESYFIRGFLLNSDSVAYNGMNSLLPRQYIATELFERVEVLRGASAFLTGASPGGDAVGGSINLVPKRAANEDLNRATVGGATGAQGQAAADISRRFGPDRRTGLRLNAAYRQGGTAIDKEHVELGLVALAADWRGRDARLSGDLGWQDNQLKRTRTNVTLGDFANPVTSAPAVPDNRVNAAQPWTFSNERDLFGTLRGEFDITPNLTAWGAYGLRRSDEANSLANLTVTNAATGDGSTYRFDNARKDRVDNIEVGLRGKLRTGAVGHEWVLSVNRFGLESRNAYAFDFANTQPTNLYRPAELAAQPAFSASAGRGNDLGAPGLTSRTRLTSFAIGDTLSLMGDAWMLTLGARHQRMDIETFDYLHAGFPNASHYDDSRVSPMLGVVYRLSGQVSLFGNYTEGLTKGDAAPATAANRGDVLPPYVAKQKEIGLKYDGGRLGLTVTAFTTDKPRGVVNAANVFTAEGKDTHRGMELTAHGEAGRGLRLLGGATWLDTEQRNTGSAATDGKRTIGVPKAQANIGAEWDVAGVRGLAIDGRVVRTGASYADAANTVAIRGWTRLDVGARYLAEVGGKLLTLRARIDNLTDRDYWSSVGGYPGTGYLVIGAPRTVSLSASVDF